MCETNESSSDDAQYLLRWIERHGKQQFTKREAHQHGRRRFPKADKIDPALKELARRGYTRPLPLEATGAGRPPSPTFEVNPEVFDFSNAKKRTQNTQNSTDNTAPPSPGGNSEDIEYTSGQFEKSISEPDPDEWGEV